MPTPALSATAEIGALGSLTNTARAACRISSSLRAACARRPLSGLVVGSVIGSMLPAYLNGLFCSTMMERNDLFRADFNSIPGREFL